MDERQPLSNGNRFLEALPQGVVVADAAGRFVEVNAQACRLLGRSGEELRAAGLDAPPWTALGPDRQPLSPEAFPGAVALREGRPVRGRTLGLVRPGGGTAWFLVSAGVLASGGVVITFEEPPEARDPEVGLEETFFRELLERQGEGFGVVDLDERFVYANPVAEEIFGADPGTLTGHSLADFLDPDQKAVVQDQTQRRLAGESNTYELRIRRRNGEQRLIQVTVTPRPATAGKPFAVIGVFRDITAFKRTQEALRESEAKFRRLMESVDQAALMLDLEGRVTFCNDFLLRITGWRREELLGEDWFVNFLPRRLGQEARMFRSGLARRTMPLHFENAILTRTGEERLLRWTNTLIKDPQGEVTGVACLGEDITDRKRSEAALRASEEKFSKAFHASPDSININRLTDGTYLAVNDGFIRITGYSREEAIGRTSLPGGLGLWVRERDRVRLVEGLRREGMVQGLEAEFRRKDGTLLTGLMSASLIEVEGEACVLSITRDITERKRAEEERAKLQAQLNQAQKMDSLGSLAGGVAHDMNNVLGAILGLASANLELQPPDSAAHRAFDTIAQAATRGGKMVKSLLAFARHHPAEVRDLDLNALLREQVQLLEHTTLSRVVLQIDLAPGLPPIRGDANALAHAFMNLCVNAVDAMDEQGTLTLSTREVDGAWIEVRVEDDGCGMPKEIQDRALDPFFTTKPVGRGTGLGLSMVYSTMQAHQGSVDLESEPGRGTTVTLRFPVAGPGAEGGPAASEEPEGPGEPLTVLLVDDDDLIQKSLKVLLETLGHEVIGALSGEEALRKLRAGAQPDVVLLDLNMPGLGGAGTLPLLRALRPAVPILLATGRADQTALDLVGSQPDVSLMSKPFSLAELRKRLGPIRPQSR